MNEVTRIGIDLGKHSFHLHAQDATGRMVFRKKMSVPVTWVTDYSGDPGLTLSLEPCSAQLSRKA